MMIIRVFTVLAVLACASDTPVSLADTATIRIDAAQSGPRINPRMYGIFLEEIGHGVDGGLYAELIRNRAFEDGKPPEGYVERDGRWVDQRGFNSGYEEYGYEVDGLPFWSLVKSGDAEASMTLEKTGGVSDESCYCMRLKVDAVDQGRAGVANEGFFGIGVGLGKQYKLSAYAKIESNFAGPLRVRLESADGEPCSDDAVLSPEGRQWRKYEATLTGVRDERSARLVIEAGSTGEALLDFVSLFPARAWQGRPGGLRPDIAQMIADLKPGFVRFPGGCVVEGGTIESAYNWKRTVGPLEKRQEQWGPWHYRRTHGVGLFEYLQFCDDLGAEPLYVGFAGQTCIFREREHVAMEDMGPVRDNFLDLVEFANGPADSRWGKVRAEASREQPFALKYVEIGNENSGMEYEERYRMIHRALKEKHPDITYLADISFHGEMPDTLYDIADVHYYNSPSWFLSHADMYDDRSRELPPLYLGEVAVTSQHGGALRGNLLAALAEGVFLLGCERNSDAVAMVSYAPLLAHIKGRSWNWHGMIYHDSTRVFGTPSYYLWKLFAEHRPDVNLPTVVDYQPSESLAIAGQVGVGTWDATAEFKDIRVEHNGQVFYESDFTRGADGWQPAQGRWEAADGVYKQTRRGQGHSYLGEDSWTNYTLTLKARQLSGGEGFLITFGRKGQDRFWWNLGGWGNAQHAIEHNQTPVGQPRRGRIEPERWYDVKIEVAGAQIKCYLDGELIHEAQAESLHTFAAVAGRDESTGEIVVKAINTAPQPVTAAVEIAGVAALDSTADLAVLTSADPQDNNSFRDPQRVAPAASKLTITGGRIEHEFPPHSMTVMRVKPK